VLLKGVLIHIGPSELPRVYDLTHRASARFICIAEYYNPTPVTITYRGRGNRLFKRDFAGEMLERFPDLRLVDYGFAYRRDPVFPQDDITWFLLEKKHA
jgi:spore coat polysaccharide biosynthesis protein SpsF